MKLRSIWPRLICLAIWGHFVTGYAVAQDPAPADSATTMGGITELTFSGYVEAYYAYDFGEPTAGDRPLLYNFSRHNEVALNLGLARVDLAKNRVRGAFALMAGTYPQANLAHEPALLRNVYEAHVGVALSRGKAIWLDAGVLPSHIGMESAVGLDNWTLTRSLNAENSPYYLSGVQVTWQATHRLKVAGLFVNGWQRMRRVQNNTPCFGTQVLWTANDRVKLNWSTFLGSDTPDSLGLYRVFNNVWWSWQGAKWGAKVAVDLGVQEKIASTGWNTWADAVAVVRRRLGKNLFVVARGEYYSDPDQIIVSTTSTMLVSAEGLTATGYSLGLDVQVMPNALVRFEGRTLSASSKLFAVRDGPAKSNTSVTVSLAAKF